MLANWGLVGHQWAVALLKVQMVNGKVRQAYLFTGPDGAGRRTLALRLAQALNCTRPPASGEFCGECRNCRGFATMQHADLLILERQEGDREIKVAALRELTRSISRTPLEAKIQVALLLDFHEASEEAANAMLKTLEEPNPSVLICITAPDADSLPATVVSRCELIRLRPLAIAALASELEGRLHIDQPHATLLASLSEGLPGGAIRMQSNPKELEQRSRWLDDGEDLLKADRVQRFEFAEKAGKDRDTLNAQLRTWLSFWRDVLLRAGGSNGAISNLDRAERIDRLAAQLPFSAIHRFVTCLERTLDQLVTNVNARLAMEVLLLELPSL